jgi:hypothetical protein
MSIYGCGAMLNGAKQTVHVNSNPSPLKVTASPEIGIYTTPTAISLERKNSYVLRFEKEGYEPATFTIQRNLKFGIVLLDVLFTGLVGVVVDAASGAWYKLSPNEVTVSLIKVGAIDGPDKIDMSINILELNNDDLIGINSSVPDVTVKVEAVK